MAFGSDIAKLLASLDLDTRPFQRGARSVDSSLNKMEGGMGRVSTRAIAFGSAIGVGIERLAEKGIDVLFDSLRAGEENLHILADTTAQTNAVIESTQGAAGQTAESVRALAESLENLTTADDKAIQQGENLLLTYTNIGADTFPTATKAMVDMAIALNKGNAETADFDSAAQALGKALQDPITGMTALRKSGVTFNEEQRERIKQLVEEGKLQEAQGVILAEVAKEYGKAGEAAGQSAAAPLRRFHDAIEGIQISLASGLSPALDEIRGELTTAMNDPATQKAVRDLGIWLGEAAKSGIAFAKSIPWGQVADGLKTAAGFAGKLIGAFTNLPPGVQATIIGLAGLNKLAGGGVIKIGVDLFKEGAKGILGQFFQRGSPTNPMFTKELGLPGGGGLPLPAPAAGPGLIGAGLGVVALTAGTVAAIGIAIAEVIEAEAAKDPQLIANRAATAARREATGDRRVGEGGKRPIFVANPKEISDPITTAIDKTAREDTPVDEIVQAIKADRKFDRGKDKTAIVLSDVFKELNNKALLAQARDAAESAGIAAKAAEHVVTQIGSGGITWRPADVIQVEDMRLPTLRDAIETARIATQTGTDTITAAIDDQQKALTKSLQPLPDDITKKEQKHFDRLRDRIETTNIRTNTRIDQTRASTDRVRDRVESARIAVQTGTTRVAQNTMTAADRIIMALRALNLISNVVVNVSGSSPYTSNGQYSNGGSGGNPR